MKGRRLFLALALAALVALALTGAASADPGGRPLSATMTGAQEVNAAGVPNQGDPNGSGTARITVNPGQREVCWEIRVSNITLPASAAHIHRAPAGVAGPVVVTLSPPDANGVSSGCAPVDRALAKDILKNSENYYVNVHTTDFPDGAIRGQL